MELHTKCPIRIRDGVLLFLWVENLYLTPHEFFSQMNNTLLLQLRCWKVSQSLHTLNIWAELGTMIEIATKSSHIHSLLKSFVVRVIALAILLGQLYLGPVHKFFTTTVVKSWRTLTFSVRPLDLTLCMLDS